MRYEGDELPVRGIYSFVAGVLEGYASSRLLRLSRICGVWVLVGAGFGGGYFLGLYNLPQHVKQHPWVKVAAIAFELTCALAGALLIACLTQARPRVWVGARKPGWWKSNRASLLIGTVTAIIGAVVTVGLTVLVSR